MVELKIILLVRNHIWCVLLNFLILLSLGLQRREDWNLALPEIRPDQNQNSSSLPRGGDQSPILSSGWGPFDQIPVFRTGGLEKQGRIGRVKERKERGKGREVNKVSCSLPVGALWPVVRVRRRPGTKGSGPLAGNLAPEYPEWSGCQSQRRRVPTRVAICCRKGDPFQGPKLGSCLTLGNELSQETHVLTKQKNLLGKGTRVESSRVREPSTHLWPKYWNIWQSL